MYHVAGGGGDGLQLRRATTALNSRPMLPAFNVRPASSASAAVVPVAKADSIAVLPAIVCQQTLPRQQPPPLSLASVGSSHSPSLAIPSLCN